MMKYVLMIGLLLGTGALVRADFATDMRAAEALCADKKHEEAIQAYVKLGEGCSDPEQRYQAFRDAALCAQQHLANVPRALQLADRITVQPYVKACRAAIYPWSPSNVVAELGNEDLTQWPEALAAAGFAMRAGAYAGLTNGQAAARDYLRAFQFAKSYEKYDALQRLGNVYWRLLGDELIAEACYRQCVAAFGGGWPGLQARVSLATLLLSQKRYDAALQCLQAPADRPGGGYWLVALLYVEAKVYADMGKTADAIATLETALKTAGIYPGQKKECDELLTTLK